MERLNMILIVIFISLLIYIIILNNTNKNTNYLSHKNNKSNKNIENFSNHNNNHIIKGLGANTNYEMVSNLYSLKLESVINPGDPTTVCNIYLKPFSKNYFIGQPVYTNTEEERLSKKFMIIQDYTPDANYKIKRVKLININQNGTVDNQTELLNTFVTNLTTHFFDHLDKLDSILPRIKNKMDVLINHQETFSELNEKVTIAERNNNTSQLTRLLRRLNSLKTEIYKDICQFQSLILSEPTEPCASIDQENYNNYEKMEDVINDLLTSAVQVIPDTSSTTSSTNNTSRNSPILNYINNFNYELLLINKMNEMGYLINDSMEGLVYLSKNLNIPSTLSSSTTTSTNSDQYINLEAIFNIRTKYNDFIKKMSSLKNQKNKILKKINKLSSEKSFVSDQHTFYQLQVIKANGDVTNDYTVLGDYLGKESHFGNPDNPNINQDILKSSKSIVIVPKHCCLWKRNWNEDDIVFRNTRADGTVITVWKNPFTNTFKITDDGNPPQEANLLGENDSNLKNGVYNFVACPDKNNQIIHKINRFNEIREGCQYLQQETQTVNLADDEIGTETEHEALSRINNNNKQIKILENRIKNLHRTKVKNTIVKQNINRFKLSEVNRKLEDLYNQLLQKMKQIYVDREFNLAFDTDPQNLMVLLEKIFNKIKNSNLPDKRNLIKKVHTMFKLKYMSDDDLKIYLENIKNDGNICTDIINDNDLVLIKQAQSCYKCPILLPTD